MNFKTPFKVLTTAALIGTLSLSAVAPGVASAADKTVTAQAETPANFALEKVILVKGDSKISVSFDTYIDVLGNEKALNGYELAYVVAANGEVFALDTYVDFYEAGNTEEEVVEKLSKAGKTSEVTEVKDGAFNDGKLEPVEPAVIDPKVESVTAINASQIEIKFSKAINKDTVIDNGKLKASNITVSTLNNANINAELSEDGKTLTLTNTSSGEITALPPATYTVTVTSAVKDTDFNKVVATSKTVEVKGDTVAPTIVGTEKVSNRAVKVNFSEPMDSTTINDTAKWTFKTAAGKTLTPKDVFTNTATDDEVEVKVSADKKSVTLTADSGVAVDTVITATLNQAKDIAGNVMEVQPATFNFTIGATNTVLPKISTVQQTGGKTFSITFDAPTVIDTSSAANSGVGLDGHTVEKVEKVSDTEYKVTTTEALNGLDTLTLATGKVKNADGVATTADLTKTVSFVKNTVAPKATTELVTVDGTQYLQLTYDKDVIIKGTSNQVLVKGSYTKDYISTDLDATGVSATIKYADETERNKKVVLVSLAGSSTANLDLAEKDAVYNVTVSNNTSNGLFSDADITAETSTATFTRGEDKDSSANPDANELVYVAADITATQPTNSTVNLEFNKAVDRETASNVANYKVNGKAVKSVKLTSATDVVITLEDGQIPDSGDYNVVVSGVKVEGSSKVMEPATVVLTATADNVRPTLDKAAVKTIASGKATELTLTFSEVVKANAAGTDLFQVFVGNSTTPITVTNANLTSNTTKTIDLTITEGLTAEQLAQGVTIKLNSAPTIATDIIDVKENIADISKDGIKLEVK